ncbi:MAG: SMP-30/gluconolactonase/LRE family protein [Mangrovicoccus sp.]
MNYKTVFAETIYQSFYPEAPIWSGENIFVPEMSKDRIARFSPNGHRTLFWSEENCGPTTIVKFNAFTYAVACHIGGYIAMVSTSGTTVERIFTLAEKELHSPNNLFGDGSGVLFISDPGDFENSKRNRGSVFFYSENKQAEVLSNMRYPNGVEYDKVTNALFVAEHLAQKVWMFSLMDDFSIGRKTVLLNRKSLFPNGVPYKLAGPDGLRLDGNGGLYIALYGAGQLAYFSKNELSFYEQPFQFVTNMAISRDNKISIVGAYTNTEFPYLGSVVVKKLPLE